MEILNYFKIRIKNKIKQNSDFLAKHSESLNKNPNHNQQEDQNDIPKNLDEPDVNTNNFSNSPEIKDCLANSDLKSKINDGFEIISETCPVIIIAAKPKGK